MVVEEVLTKIQAWRESKGNGESTLSSLYVSRPLSPLPQSHTRICLMAMKRSKASACVVLSLSCLLVSSSWHAVSTVIFSSSQTNTSVVHHVAIPTFKASTNAVNFSATIAIAHPYEEHWPPYTLPEWATKVESSIEYTSSISKEKQVCLVAIGGTSDSISCKLGFRCNDNDLEASILPGFLPKYTTHMFKNNVYDCEDDSAYFLFVVIHPLVRIKRAIQNDKPIDWDAFKLREGEKNYKRRKNFYLDCPFDTLESLVSQGLSHDGSAEKCKQRAESALMGTEHFGNDVYFGYQYHAEGIPGIGRVMTIRAEHFEEDLRSVELELAGKRQGTPLSARIQNNAHKVNADVFSLSEELQSLICNMLCNEIQSYKQILNKSINLSGDQVAQSVEELIASCPTEATSTKCNKPRPDITNKLKKGRGYGKRTSTDSRRGWQVLDFMKKDPTKYLQKAPKESEVCLVHIGKSGGTSLACSLGFNSPGYTDPCPDEVTPGLLPQYTTRRFHLSQYDCFDDSAFYLFLIRNPYDRLISAFNYDNVSRSPKNFERVLSSQEFAKRKKLFLDCPFTTIEKMAQLGLSKAATATDVCKQRAHEAIYGTENYSAQLFCNLQFYLESIPKDAKILALRTEHLSNDWHSAEVTIGGDLNQTTNIAQKNVNDYSEKKEKLISDNSRNIICEKLCNEILVYRTILQHAANLNHEQVQASIDELKESCPVEAVTTSCSEPLPDISDKLKVYRGYYKNEVLDSATGEISIGRSVHVKTP